jgi:hypothetical protein
MNPTRARFSLGGGTVKAAGDRMNAMCRSNRSCAEDNQSDPRSDKCAARSNESRLQDRESDRSNVRVIAIARPTSPRHGRCVAREKVSDSARGQDPRRGFPDRRIVKRIASPDTPPAHLRECTCIDPWRRPRRGCGRRRHAPSWPALFRALDRRVADLTALQLDIVRSAQARC